ncbi:MAG: DinB family protein [Gemmatimonadetes bacterium]|nr:DinB family protein [Gemmatimonadota bacterium]
MTRPAADEFNEYYRRYIDLVPDGDILATLKAQMAETQGLLASVPADREEYRYAEGKWSVREVVGHLVDTEHLFAFRALWAARGAAAEQPSMEQNAWADVSNAGGRPLAELAEEWAALRRAVVLMGAGFDEGAWSRRGVASGNAFSVRAAMWIVAGHELHHRRLLEQKYLGEGA